MHGPIGARVYDPTVRIADRLFLDHRRDRLGRDLAGSVLEIGVGSGLQWSHLGVETTAPSTRYVGLDPDRRLLGRASKRCTGDHADLVEARGEAVPCPDDTFDYVISAMVLCSVTDPSSVLDEIARVLKPAGEFRMLEHVAASGFEGRIQSMIQPIWSRVAGGCRPDRPTHEIVAAHGSFEPIETNFERIGVPPVRPFVTARYESG